ncbi:carboxypeptidase-like regulatory domain-containing protein [Aquimarina sp. Aq78]|uniref:carboxypeptidase-like regulatory domain-containing protein n=1 Tax=Aquimarina sp. Aq78 TaxID=1191889 RepID=UPI001F1BB5A5|nr:carboxypeptidase-like regulatory domain-containing protein [Aquimarina sp. Aq78]
MGQSIQHDRYPKFVADQVLTEKSLNQMFGYLEEQQRLTRTTLIGIGVMCGMEVSVNASRTALTISQGVGVTSKGYLVPFPETTYTFYNDEFSAEQEFMYPPFINAITKKQKFPLYLLHNNGAAEIKKPITASFLEDKVVVVFVELLKVDNKNCDPDSCDDKGCTVEVTHRPLLVDRENLNELIFSGANKKPFLHESSCIEWPEVKIPRYNVPSTLLLSSQEVLKNFLKILDRDFIFDLEKVLTAAYGSLGYYIKDEFPNNPFLGLRNNFKFLFDGSITAQQLLHIQYYYDFFSDLIYAYEELRKMCNECLTLCCPNQDLFPRHLILGNAISSEDEFRHHWIQSPAFSCNCCSEGKIKFLLKKIALLIKKLEIPFSSFTEDRRIVKVTPSSYGDIALSDKAIPYYYDIVNGPDELYNHWNFKKTRLKKGDTNLSYDANKYGANKYIKDPLNYDIEPHNFFRVEGHLGMNWKSALAQVNKVKNEKRLPIDVVALNGDVFELFRSLLSNKNSLSEIISGNKDIIDELICYFADIESQYDAHAAELRCTILKVMVYFYNLPVVAGSPVTETNNFPESDMVRKKFPNYKTKTNTYGEAFDKFYAPLKNADYITPLAFSTTVGFAGIPVAANNQIFLLNPVYVMYYLEKIHEALADGLVDLKINVLTQRLEDASNVAAYMLLLVDNLSGSDNNIELPSLWEESLAAVTWICKADVFNVLYRNFLFNYALFITNQTFAMYAFRNSGVQHKAGVTTGGTFILVYNDKREIRTSTITGTITDVTGASLPGANIIVKGTTQGTTSDFDGNYSITVSDPDTAVLVVSYVGYQTKEEQVKGRSNVNITLTGSSTIVAIGNFATAEDTSRAATDATSRDFREFVRAKAHKRAANTSNPISEVRNSKSVKGLEFNRVFKEFESFQKSDRLTSDELKSLVNQFPDGTVIADFFVPNMCKASCMPMNFMVIGGETEPDPTEIRLEMKYDEYCENDDVFYDITTEPEGGVLKVDGTVINENRFRPIDYKPGNNSIKEITITYEINGDSKSITVKVYHVPELRTGIKTIDREKRIVEFENDTLFAEKYAWDFGNGKTSEEKDPGPIEYGNLLTATAKLTAYNGPCQESQSIPIDFATDVVLTETRLCTPIDEIAAKFKILDKNSTDEFKSGEQYIALKTIFIDKFSSIQTLPQKEQFKLLTGQIPVSTILEIIKSLNSIITSDSKQRRPALLLYEILLKLTLFYACCQKGDVNKAKVKTEKVLGMMIRQINSWRNSVKFTNPEKKILDSMKKITTGELTKASSETPNKVIYIQLLKKLDDVLTQLIS